MPDDFEDNRGLIDDDPALDYILYEEMNKEDGKGGCFGMILFLPALYFMIRTAA